MSFSHFNIHRAPFQKALAKTATETGVKILRNVRVASIEESGESPVAITKDGRRFEADIIIGADDRVLLEFTRTLADIQFRRQVHSPKHDVLGNSS